MSALAYQYRGYDAHGKSVNGQVVASSIEEAEEKLLGCEVVLVSIQPARRESPTRANKLTAQVQDARESAEAREATSSNSVGARKISAGEAANILRSLSIMLEAGVPFVEGLDGVILAATPAQAVHLESMRSEIIGGKSVSRAMRSVPKLFPSMAADMAHVAEEGGRLDRALASAANHLERTHEFKKRVISAMLYPAMMVGVSFITVLVLVLFVIPSFTQVFAEMKVEIPPTLSLMLIARNTCFTYPIQTFGSIIGTVLFIRLASRNDAVRRLAARIMRKVPLLGELLMRIAISRSFSSIATLLGANVSMLAALEQGAAVSGDSLLRDALLSARRNVEQGAGLCDSLRSTGAIPASYLQMISVGERTGRLPALLEASVTQMERDVDQRLKSATALLEPAVIVIMGGLVTLITVSIITPIYSVIEGIK